MDEDKSSKNIGFRCAMTRTGSVVGNDEPEGNQFKVKKKKVKRRYK
jgi:sulfatase modifying factor 1